MLKLNGKSIKLSQKVKKLSKISAKLNTIRMLWIIKGHRKSAQKKAWASVSTTTVQFSTDPIITTYFLNSEEVSARDCSTFYQLFLLLFLPERRECSNCFYNLPFTQ